MSYNELATLLGIDRGTVECYVALLEKAFVIFQLPFSRNLRKELARLRKVYFYDLVNALINNSIHQDLRNDTGAIVETSSSASA